jgi:hypothetical protein
MWTDVFQVIFFYPDMFEDVLGASYALLEPSHSFPDPLIHFHEGNAPFPLHGKNEPSHCHRSICKGTL